MYLAHDTVSSRGGSRGGRGGGSRGDADADADADAGVGAGGGTARLDVSSHGWTARELRSILPLPASLTELNVSHNALGPEAGALLGDCIALETPLLTCLDVSHNSLGSPGLSALLSSLQLADSLVSLNAAANGAQGRDLLLDIAAVLGGAAGSSLARLDLTGNGWDRDALANLGSIDPTGIVLAELGVAAVADGGVGQGTGTGAGADVGGAGGGGDTQSVLVLSFSRGRDALVAAKMHEYLESPFTVSAVASDVDAGSLTVDAPFLLLNDVLGLTVPPVDAVLTIVECIVAGVRVLVDRGAVHMALTPRAIGRYAYNWRIGELGGVTLEDTPMAASTVDMITPYAAPEVVAALLRGAPRVVALPSMLLWQTGVVLAHLYAPELMGELLAAHPGDPVGVVQAIVDGAVAGMPSVPSWVSTGLLALSPESRILDPTL